VACSPGIEINLLQQYQVGFGAGKEFDDAAQLQTTINVPINNPNRGMRPRHWTAWRKIANFDVLIVAHSHVLLFRVEGSQAEAVEPFSEDLRATAKVR
jgi:hypothetical protein